MVWEISKGKLDVLAEQSEPDVAKELTKASKKIASYSRSPGNRKDADRFAPVLTPAVVTAIGNALVEIRQEEIDTGVTEWFAYGETEWALAGLLIAAGDPALADSSADPLQRLLELIPQMAPKQVEPIQYLSTQFSELDIATELRAAAGLLLGAQPETPGEEWARLLELDTPAEYWSFSFSLPGEHADGHVDALVAGGVDNFPGDRSNWNLRIGALNMNPLGSNIRQGGAPGYELGEYEREGRSARVAGKVAPAESPMDFPRIIAEIAAANPAYTFDFTGVKMSGGPGRMATPTRKKKLIAWLQSALPTA